jgi:hypothetical protein
MLRTSFLAKNLANKRYLVNHKKPAVDCTYIILFQYHHINHQNIFIKFNIIKQHHQLSMKVTEITHI